MPRGAGPTAQPRTLALGLNPRAAAGEPRWLAAARQVAVDALLYTGPHAPANVNDLLFVFVE